jgi:hypothetical protein
MYLRRFEGDITLLFEVRILPPSQFSDIDQWKLEF